MLFAEQRDRASPEKSSQAADPPSPGGGRRQGEGKGAGSAPRTAAPTPLQTGLQSLTKDLLRFWMVDIRREGRGETRGAGTRPARAGTGAGAGEGRGRPASSWLPEPLRRGRRKTQAQLFVPHFCGGPDGWNRAQRRAAPYRAAGSLSSVDGKTAPPLPAAQQN